jgi:hypothetical protein
MCGILSAAKWTGCLTDSICRRCGGCSTRNLRGDRQLIQTFLRWRSTCEKTRRHTASRPRCRASIAKDIDVSVSDDTLVLKGEKH